MAAAAPPSIRPNLHLANPAAGQLGGGRHLVAVAPAPRRTAASGAVGRRNASVYARRRIAVGVLLAVVGAVVWTVATWAANSSVGVAPVGADRTGTPQQIHIVQPGETLWSIAAELDTDGDVRDTVDRLAERNGGSSLSAGQRLVLGG